MAVGPTALAVAGVPTAPEEVAVAQMAPEEVAVAVGPPELWLRFADGTQRDVLAVEAARVLRGYAVSARIFRSRRVFDMVVEYVEKHADYDRRGSVAEPDIAAWDRRFMEQVDDTDTLHDLLLTSQELEEHQLMDLCAQRTADMIRGRTVEDITSLLGIVGITPEQHRRVQDDHDRLLRITR